MPSYKLIYFPSRGRAEAIRLMFSAAEVEYEDCRITAEITKLKQNGKLPFGQLPVLEVDGKMLAQSMTIFKFVARETGFSPSDSWTQARADMIVDGLGDLTQKAVAIFIEKDEEKKKELKKALYESHIPGMLSHLEKLLKANDGKHFAGSKMSYADILFFSIIDSLYLNEEMPKELEKFPLLKGLFSKIKSLPGIQKWLKERPVTEA